MHISEAAAGRSLTELRLVRVMTEEDLITTHSSAAGHTRHSGDQTHRTAAVNCILGWSCPRPTADMKSTHFI